MGSRIESYNRMCSSIVRQFCSIVEVGLQRQKELGKDIKLIEALYEEIQKDPEDFLTTLYFYTCDTIDSLSKQSKQNHLPKMDGIEDEFGDQ